MNPSALSFSSATLVSERPFPQVGFESDEPFLTIAVPHYKHRRYFEIVLASLFEQTSHNFEILVSDDCSPDDSKEVLPSVLEASGRPFRFYHQPSNLGYDGNVRFCLAQARGRYVFLLGNDDALTSPTTVEEIEAALRQLDFPTVAFTNYEDWSTPNSVVGRAVETKVLGSGPDVALRFFRSFSFVSGLIYDRAAAAEHDTSKWDKSIYYQIYLASRIIARGGTLAGLSISAVRANVRIDDQTVPNYATKWANAPWSLQARSTGLDSVIRVTADAILPTLAPRERSAALRRIVGSILTTTYPHWLFEYRRIANWSYAFGVARDLWPGTRLRGHRLGARHRQQIWLLYWGVTFFGLLAPAGVVEKFKGRVAQLVRQRQQAKS